MPDFTSPSRQPEVRRGLAAAGSQIILNHLKRAVEDNPDNNDHSRKRAVRTLLGALSDAKDFQAESLNTALDTINQSGLDQSSFDDLYLDLQLLAACEQAAVTHTHIHTALTRARAPRHTHTHTRRTRTRAHTHTHPHTRAQTHPLMPVRFFAPLPVFTHRPRPTLLPSWALVPASTSVLVCTSRPSAMAPAHLP